MTLDTLWIYLAMVLPKRAKTLVKPGLSSWRLHCSRPTMMGLVIVMDALSPFYAYR